MNKILALITALFLGMVALAGPAAATGGHGDKPTISGKSVTLCHYDGSNNNGGSGKYSKITVDINGFLSGHNDHDKDIWAAFSYVKRTGSDTWETVNVVAQGDTSRLAFDKCKTPDDDEKVAKPTAVYTDECGTKNDVFSVVSGRGYTVNPVRGHGDVLTITVTLLPDFVWADGTSTPITFQKPLFTDEDCDLPETGGAATYNTALGGAALAGVILLGGVMLYTRKRA